MRIVSTSLLVLGLAATTASSAWSLAQTTGDGKKRAAGEDKKRMPKFTISKETTCVTGPVDARGYIDYAAALNERLRQGVTPANNANVLLWRAFGPQPEGATMPAEFFKWLGIEPPSKKGDYFIGVSEHMKKHLQVDPNRKQQELHDEYYQERPWTSKQYPHVAGWLIVNEKPLALVVEATKRTHYFSPLVPTKTAEGAEPLLTALVPGLQKCRELTNALRTRAMLHLGEARYDDAWQDLLACHRLGRQAGRGGLLLEGLVGIAIDAIASGGDLVFLDRAKLDARRIKECLRDLRSLPPMPSVVDKIHVGERFILLQTILLIDRHGIKYLESLSATEPGRPPNPLAESILENINWDPALRNINRFCDRAVAAMGMADRASRAREMEKLETELKMLKNNLMESGELANLLVGTPEAKGKAIGDILLCLISPASQKVLQASDRIEQTHRNLHVAFALAAYQRDHGRYPQDLNALAPKYLPQVPSDLFSGQALIYRPALEGYLLYSVGPNGRDDQGRWYDDNPPGDDPNVRMPLPQPRR